MIKKLRLAPFLLAALGAHTAPALFDSYTSPLPLILKKQFEAVDHVIGLDEQEMAWRDGISKTEDLSSMPLSDLLENIQRHTMGVNEGSLQSRRKTIDYIVAGLEELQARGFHKKELVNLMLQMQGDYNSAQASSAYLLEGKAVLFKEGANCYGRFDLLADIYVSMYPNDIEHMHIDTVMVQDAETGSSTPHIRLMLDDSVFEEYDDNWYVIEGGEIYVTDVPPSYNIDIRAALANIAIGNPSFGMTDDASDPMEASWSWSNLWNFAPGVRALKSQEINPHIDISQSSDLYSVTSGKSGEDKEPESKPKTAADIISDVCPANVLQMDAQDDPKSWVKLQGKLPEIKAAHQKVLDETSFRVLWIIEGENDAETREAYLEEVAANIWTHFDGSTVWERQKDELYEEMNPEEKSRQQLLDKHFLYANPTGIFEVPGDFSSEEVGWLLDNLITYHESTASTYDWGPFNPPNDYGGTSHRQPRYELLFSDVDQLTEENLDKFEELVWPPAEMNAPWWERSQPVVWVPDTFNNIEEVQRLWYYRVSYMIDYGINRMVEEWMRWTDERGRVGELFDSDIEDGFLQGPTSIRLRFYDDELEMHPLRTSRGAFVSKGRLIVKDDCRDMKYLEDSAE